MAPNGISAEAYGTYLHRKRAATEALCTALCDWLCVEIDTGLAAPQVKRANTLEDLDKAQQRVESAQQTVDAVRAAIATMPEEVSALPLMMLPAAEQLLRDAEYSLRNIQNGLEDQAEVKEQGGLPLISEVKV